MNLWAIPLLRQGLLCRRNLADYYNIMEILQKLKEYMDDNRGSLPPVADPDEPLQLDSLGVIRLVAFLETDLGIRVDDEELIADNFATLRTIEELLANKTPTVPTREG
jgi:acyl carrier protein